MPRHPKQSVDVVRAIRRAYDDARREGRRPRLKSFTRHGIAQRTVSDIARRLIYRWVQP
jgi:hypothetical protein